MYLRGDQFSETKTLDFGCARRSLIVTITTPPTVVNVCLLLLTVMITMSVRTIVALKDSLYILKCDDYYACTDDSWRCNYR